MTNSEVKDFYYDATGGLIKVKLATVCDPKSEDDVRPTYRYIYDDYGNQVSILDPNDRLTVFKYNELNQQTVTNYSTECRQ